MKNPKPWKDKGFGHLKTRFSKNCRFWGPMVYILYIVTWLVGNETSKHLQRWMPLPLEPPPRKFEARSERRLIGGIFRGCDLGDHGRGRTRNEDSSYPKNPWDVGFRVSSCQTCFEAVFSGCHERRVWCFNKRGQDY